MNSLDLKKFCYSDDLNYSEPFSYGNYTYATDRALIVRVPRLPHIPESGRIDINKVLILWPGEYPVTDIPAVEFPKPCECVCKICLRADPDCDECGGVGFGYASQGPVARSIQIRHLSFHQRRMMLLAQLPFIAMYFGPEHREEVPVYCRFDGGDALIMPMNTKDKPL